MEDAVPLWQVKGETLKGDEDICYNNISQSEYFSIISNYNLISI